MMDESRYQKLAEVALRAIEDMLEDVDAEVVDVERAGDVLTLTFATRQEGRHEHAATHAADLARGERARLALQLRGARGHGPGRWLDDKGQGVELVAQVAAIVKEVAGRRPHASRRLIEDCTAMPIAPRRSE